MRLPSIIKHWRLSVDDLSEYDITYLGSVGCKVDISYDTHPVVINGQTYQVAGKRTIKITTNEARQESMLLLKFGKDLWLVETVTYDSVIIGDY